MIRPWSPRNTTAEEKGEPAIIDITRQYYSGNIPYETYRALEQRLAEEQGTQNGSDPSQSEIPCNDGFDLGSKPDERS